MLAALIVCSVGVQIGDTALACVESAVRLTAGTSLLIAAARC